MYVVLSREGFFSGFTDRKFETDYVFSVEIDDVLYEKLYQYFIEGGANILLENEDIVLEKYLEDESKVRLYYRNGDFVPEQKYGK